jgi:hypothetical protein
MARTEIKENKMVSYMIKSKLAEHLPEMLDEFETSHKHTFSKQDRNELIETGEEIIEQHFPTSSYTFTLSKKETKYFDNFINDFVQAFMGALVAAMYAHMNLVYVVDRLDAEMPDEAA